MDAGVGLGLSGLPTGNISSGDIRDAVADIVSDPSFRGSATVLSGVLRWGTLESALMVFVPTLGRLASHPVLLYFPFPHALFSLPTFPPSHPPSLSQLSFFAAAVAIFCNWLVWFAAWSPTCVRVHAKRSRSSLSSSLSLPFVSFFRHDRLVPTPSPRRPFLFGLLLDLALAVCDHRRAGGTLRAADVVEGTLQLGGSSHLHPPELRGPWHEVVHPVAVGVA